MHDLDRHDGNRRPRHLAEQSEQSAGEDVGVRRATVLEDRLPGAPHVWGVGVVAEHLEREIGLYARRHVETAVLKQRPAAARLLVRANIPGKLDLKTVADRRATEMMEEDVFRGDRHVGLELEHEMTVGPLRLQESRLGAVDRAIEPVETGRQGLLVAKGGLQHCPLPSRMVV